MTNEEAINSLANFKRYISGGGLVDRKANEAIDMAIKALDQISHLKDRPCEACEFHTEEGCSKWECVFEGSDTE